MIRKILAFAGVLFCMWGCYCIYFGFANYQAQQSQKDWPVTDAAAISVERRRESSGGRRHSSSRWVYDITYEYTVGGTVYTGEIIGTISQKEIGESFSIKYDPKAPSVSTDILSPQPDALAANLLGGLFFLAIGIWAIVFPPGRKEREYPDFPRL